MDQKETANVTRFCDESRFNRFHAGLLILGLLTLIFDGYDTHNPLLRNASYHKGMASYAHPGGLHYVVRTRGSDDRYPQVWACSRTGSAEIIPS